MNMTYQITSLLVNPLGKLGLYGALNLMQETAWMHAETLGFGANDMEREGLYWVLTRQKLQMQEWPQFGEKISVETWLRPPEGAFVTREFLLRNGHDNVIGACSTSWLALQRETRKILPIQHLRSWEDITRPQNSGVEVVKIPVEGDYEKLAKYRVRNSDLDINQHVNNTKYAQWILDAVPYDMHKALFLSSYSVNFLAETHLGEEVQIDVSTNSTDVATEKSGTATYRGLRVLDNKVLFTATLDWEKRG
ncbi:MAG: acyl-[acyl-carrier-protein] thioesterase [Bdellovibrio sp.]|nr:acyl-[acyl-carrier-protein] thioesterase [Bdellovibrio sp.]